VVREEEKNNPRRLGQGGCSCRLSRSCILTDLRRGASRVARNRPTVTPLNDAYAALAVDTLKSISFKAHLDHGDPAKSLYRFRCHEAR